MLYLCSIPTLFYYTEVANATTTTTTTTSTTIPTTDGCVSLLANERMSI